MSSAFTRAQWTAAAATLASLTAMLLYPGGTARNHATIGYTVTGNFLSDLGMTAAYDGQPNRIGAALFVTSIGLLVVGMGGALAGFVRLYASNTRARRFAYAAATAGVIDCACFIGVALTPENRAMAHSTSHSRSPHSASCRPPRSLITLAARATPTTPPRIVMAWAALTAVLIVYVVMLQGGAWTATAAGFVAQVIAPKVVAIVMVSVMVWQCHVATTMMPPPAPIAAPARPT
jgi:hypothetical protein